LIKLKEEFGMKVDSLVAYPICLLKNMKRYGQFSKHHCGAGKVSCTIGADGQLRPCGHSDDRYGNTIEEPISQIWTRLKVWRDGSLLPDECKQCRYIFECSGGCRMDCKYYGKIDSMDPYATGNEFEYIPQTSIETEPISLKAKYIVNPALHFRTEKFGEALIIDGNFKSVITLDSAKLLKKLMGNEFTLEQILKEYNLEIGVLHKYFTNLYKQDIICMIK
jgi:radical SAM protein with 4Fe4S-binding SPASM domain